MRYKRVITLLASASLAVSIPVTSLAAEVNLIVPNEIGTSNHTDTHEEQEETDTNQEQEETQTGLIIEEPQSEDTDIEDTDIEDSNRGRKIFCVYGKNSSLIRNRYV